VGTDTRGNLYDVGRYAVTKKDEDMGCRKTPALHNLTNRGPYMHDSSFPTVKDTLVRYIGGAN
jgi:cytochrome c peroxidase